MRYARTIVALCHLLAARPALAEASGRTDGPERSEIGKGGYAPAPVAGGAFSLQLDGGGAVGVKDAHLSPPLFVGGTATYWAPEHYRLDLSGVYLHGDAYHVWEALVGPTLLSTLYPLSAGVGLQAGAYLPGRGDPRFVLSPRIGIAFITDSHLQMGLNASCDVTLGATELSIVRVYLSIGYRL